eukprot:gene9541-13352_t
MSRIDALRRGEWQHTYRAAYTDGAWIMVGYPSINGPNHAAIMTGTTPAQNG